MDSIYQSTATGQMTQDNANKLHQALLDIGAAPGTPGVSGQIIFDQDGDRQGQMDLVNLKIQQGSRRLRGEDGRFLAQVPIQQTNAVFSRAGQYNPSSKDLQFIDGYAVVFPGPTSVEPLDYIPPPTSTTKEADNTGIIITVVIIIAIIVCCFTMCFSGYWWRTQRSFKSLKKDLDELKNTMVGVLAVVQDYDPRKEQGAIVMGDPVVELGSSPAPPGVMPQAYRSYWYWAEDAGRLESHNQNDVYQPGNFVKYAGSVIVEIEDAWSQWNAGKGSSRHKVNLSDRIGSTGTEQKAHAKESGVDFEIDFDKMQQINTKTGFGRTVFRRQVEITAAKPPTESNFRAAGSGGASGSKSLSSRPADLQQEDFLVIYTGQLIQYSKKRPDGWAFGVILYDEVEDRPAFDVVGFSATSGWFPLECTDQPDTKQMQTLQKVMGGDGSAALKMPDYWDDVKDPLKYELFRLPDGPEKKNVVDQFKTTLAPTTQVVSVDRIENMSLWQSYAIKRQTVSLHGDGVEVEKSWLFHGTTEDTVPKIMQQGFNRSFCGRNATMYGKGVYFARDASYSAHPLYSKPDANGVKRILLCRVAVGSFCLGKKDALTPDMKDASSLYDTTVDNMRDPSIYVTYHDGQAYPEYLVHFKQ
jgi:poly [ADP-ribose] polymerase 10/14/15